MFKQQQKFLKVYNYRINSKFGKNLLSKKKISNINFCFCSYSRIEPGLFECTGWYTASETSDVLTMPRFMTKKELLENKYVIDKNYHEQMTIGEISHLETELEFYQRSHVVASNILKIHENEYITQIQQGQATAQQQMNVLFIGIRIFCFLQKKNLFIYLAHAPSLETCTRKLCGGKFRPDTLPHVIRNVDFLTVNKFL